MAAKPLIIGQEISGVALLRLVQDSPHGELREYAVRYLCCGKTATITQRQIMERRSRGQTRCHVCATRAANHSDRGRHAVTMYAVGAVVANVRVEAVTAPGHLARSIIYAVTHLCCGKQSTLTHHQITDRLRREVVYCAHCAQRTGAAHRLARVVASEPMADFRVISEMPADLRPKPKIYASDIERHLARVFGR